MEPSRAPSSIPASERLGLWGPVLLYCALIFALSSISSVPALPGHMNDKTAHALLYSGLGFLVARALSGGAGRPVNASVPVIVLAFAALYGLSDEFHQLFVPRRSFDSEGPGRRRRGRRDWPGGVVAVEHPPEVQPWHLKRFTSNATVQWRS